MWLPRPFSFGHAPTPLWCATPPCPWFSSNWLTWSSTATRIHPESVYTVSISLTKASLCLLIEFVCKKIRTLLSFLRNWKSASSEFVRINTIHFEVMTLENIPSLPEAFFDQNSLLTKGTLGIFCFYQIMKNHHILLLFFQSQVFVVAFLQLDLPIP